MDSLTLFRRNSLHWIFTWPSTRGHVIESRRCEPRDCRMFLLRKFSLALCEVDMNFRWTQDAPISAPQTHSHCYGCALVSAPATADASSLLLVRRVSCNLMDQSHDINCERQEGCQLIRARTSALFRAAFLRMSVTAGPYKVSLILRNLP